MIAGEILLSVVIAAESGKVVKAKDSEVRQAEYLRKPQIDLDERYIKKLDGKEFVLYQGLLDLSHQKGLKKLSVQLLQFPSCMSSEQVGQLVL